MNHSERAQKRGINGHFSLRGKGNADMYETVKLGPIAGGKNGVQLLSSQVISDDILALHHKRSSELVINPRNTVPADILEKAQQVIDFDVHNGDFLIDGVVLRIPLTNLDTGSQQIAPTELCFSQLEYYFNGSSSNPAARSTGLEWWLDNKLAASTEEMTQYANIEGTSVAYGAPTAIAAGATVNLYVRLPGPFDYSPLPACLFETMTIRLRTLGINCFVSTGNNVDILSMGAPSIILDTVHIPHDEIAAIKYKASQPSGLTYKFLGNIHEEQSQTLANNATITLNMNSTHGISPQLIVCARASTTGSGLYTFANVFESFEIQDKNSSTLMAGGNSLNATKLRYHDFAKNFPKSTFTNTHAVFPICFVPGGAETIKASGGKTLGFEAFSESKLRIMTNGNAGGSTYTIDMLLKVYQSWTFYGRDNSVAIHSS